MARFHLNPKRSTTSEGGIVSTKLVKEARAELVIEAVSPSTIRMRLEGRVHWGSDYDASQATTLADRARARQLGNQSDAVAQLFVIRRCLACSASSGSSLKPLFCGQGIVTGTPSASIAMSG